MPIRNASLVLICLILTGCQKLPVRDEVDKKLAHIHATSVPAPIVMRPDEMVDKVDYQASIDPFVSPFINRQTDDAPSTDDKQVAAKDQKNQADETTKTPKVIFGKKIIINPNRLRQTLERYALSDLKYQGQIEKGGRLSALITSPDGAAHSVEIGQYIGQNHGRIVRISRDEIAILEARLQADGQYYEQMAYLRFAER